ncbi:MAG: nuclear transport factor 2 family protein [Chitinophagaceae bacterium]|nr:nuclear transport factor 2 family protein [Rubrivivax sp.]
MKIDFDTWLALQALYADYAAALDARELSRWPDFFTEDCSYRVQSRENFDRGLPLATLAFESRGMLKDRVVGAVDTIYHDPYLQRHVTAAPRVLKIDDRGLHCEASYIVVRTKPDAMPEILSVGRYIDLIVATPAGLRFAQRWVIFDNDLIANSIIDPL